MLMRRIKYWWNRAEREESLRREMAAHLEEKAGDLRSDGLSEKDARGNASRAFGNRTQMQEESRQIWIARYFTDLMQDARYALRSLRANPSFALVTIVSAALGIAACSTVFGIVNYALLRPLPVEEPQRLLAISCKRMTERVVESVSYVEMKHLRDNATSLESVAAFFPLLPAGISAQGEAKRSWGFLVTGNYFDVVKPRFAVGRGFAGAEDDVPGAPGKIVLGHPLWQSRFSGDRNIVGQTIAVNKKPMTVVGVTAPGFHGTETGLAPEFYLPLSQIEELSIKMPANRDTDFNTQWLMVLGRLKPGRTSQQAQAEADVLERALSAKWTAFDKERGLYIEQAGQINVGLRKVAVPAFALLMVVTILVLLTACANVANLMLARASARAKEISTRLAIGASRARLMRQLLTESMMLALLGGVLGVVLTDWMAKHISSFKLPIPVPIDIAIHTDYRVVLFSFLLSLMTGAAFGLVPALRATRTDLVSAIKGAEDSIAGLRRFGMRNLLVVSQVAISAVLVICAALFLRSLSAVYSVDTGMDPRNVLLVEFAPQLSRYKGAPARQLLIDALHEAKSMPGVQSASITDLLPLSIGGSYRTVSKSEDKDRLKGQRTAFSAVAPGYFASMGIKMNRGRDFVESPETTPVAIMNEELAAKLFPNQDPIGRQIALLEKNVMGKMVPTQYAKGIRVIGVVANSKYSTLQEAKMVPILYVPLLDTFDDLNLVTGLALIVKTSQSPLSLAGAMRQKLMQRDSQLVVTEVSTMDTHLYEALFLPRLAVTLFGLCGAIGLLIASVGIYGVVSFAVARRRREIGIRMALGAHVSQVMRMVLSHGAGLSVVGIAIGTLAGLALSKLAGSLLFGVNSFDALTFIAVPCVLFAVAMIATTIPARRAASLDPNRTLRTE